MPELENDAQRADAQNSGHQTLQAWLNTPRFREGMARILPSQLESERFHTLAIRQLSAVPELASCTPISVVGALMQSASLGLEPGTNGECWLIPWENSKKDPVTGEWYKVKEAALQIGYLGHLALAWRSDRIKSVQANYVMKGDKFSHQNGTDGFLHHVPADDRSTDPKDMTHAYGLIETVNGGKIWWVLTKKEVERIRNSGPSKNSPAWKDWYMEMAVAKALKRALKFAPKTREMARAVSIDDEHDAGVPQAFEMEIPTDLLPANVAKSNREAQAEAMMGQMADQKAKRSESEGPAGEEPPIPTEVVDNREPVMAADERQANRESTPAPDQAQKAPPVDPDGPGW